MSLNKADFNDRQLIELIYEDVDKIKKKLDGNFVAKERYDREQKEMESRVSRLEKAIIGGAVFVLVAVGGAVLSLVLIK